MLTTPLIWLASLIAFPFVLIWAVVYNLFSAKEPPAEELTNEAIAGILNDTRSLLESAHERATQQGIPVYEEVIKELENTSDDETTIDCLDYLDKALRGISAHGYYTYQEDVVVERLRAKLLALGAPTFGKRQ